MRPGWLVALFILAGAPADARSKPVARPRFQRECLTVQPWAKLAECTQRTAPGSKVVEWSKELRVVHTTNAGVYLFLGGRDGNWRHVAHLGDANYELLSVAPSGKTSVRIEMAHVVDFREHKPAWFRERVVVICAPGFCQQRVTACTVMRGGRAVETFRATFEMDDNGVVTETGDRSKAGIHCARR